ncbi:peptide/nickel transport system ATP-binding protein [Izhakiella capsodis]|uniref:Peptide/nickel transport system ATP-binding protein n=1 Tax=Izhakiella capsodis TaxID=1367852 RepID=A0A1I4VV56_9GAMM|nr:peptide/nickel transport system ATP-binding protein [Izhakiella capsodis]
MLQLKILLLDDPISTLDMSIQAEMLNVLNILKSVSRVTIVLISRDPDVIGHMFSRAIHMAASHIDEREVADSYPLK